MILLLTIIGVLLVAMYFYGTRNFDYWSKRGIKYEKPVIFFGGWIRQYIDNVSLSERFASLYRAYPDEKVIGFFEGSMPAVLVRDPEIIKHVLLTDFRHIRHRGLLPKSEEQEVLMRNLFTLEGDMWKLMRQKLTPTFSTGKLKAMFPIIVQMTDKLKKMAEKASEKEEVDIRDLITRYTADFIGSCGYGIDFDALNQETSDFHEYCKRIFLITYRDLFYNIMKRAFPKTFKHATYFAPDIEKKTLSIVRQVMSQRNYKYSGRNDFMDLLLELRQQGKMIGESIDKRNPDGSPKVVELELDDELLAAQIFVFVGAGFETSSSASSYFLHILAYHPEVQERCQKEIDEVLAKHNGKLCFEAVKDMKYLEMAFKESMRVQRSPGTLFRRTTSKYTIPGTNVTLDEGTFIAISLEGLYGDKKYFEDPEDYRPERFHPGNADKIKKCTFMPFGDGPRSCIGERMGLMQALAGVAAILSEFSLKPSRSSVREPKIDPRSILVSNIIDGLPLAIRRRQN